jgi:hypothetical protein
VTQGDPRKKEWDESTHTTAGCGGIDPCTPGICERLSTPSDESYACIMLRRSITLKTVVGPAKPWSRLLAWHSRRSSLGRLAVSSSTAATAQRSNYFDHRCRGNVSFFLSHFLLAGVSSTCYCRYQKEARSTEGCLEGENSWWAFRADLAIKCATHSRSNGGRESGR